MHTMRTLRRRAQVSSVVARHRSTRGETSSMTRARIRTILRWTPGALSVAAAAYATYVAATWVRYGHAGAPGPESADPLLDRFIPTYDIAERHHVYVRA